MGTQRKKSNSNGIKFKESLPERNLVLHEQDEDHYAQAMPLTLTPEQQERVVDFMTGVADVIEETTPQERITSRLALQFLASKDFAVQPSVNLYKNFSRLIHQYEITSPYFLQLSHFVSLLSLSLPPEILALSTVSPRSSFSLPTPSTSWFYPFSSKSTSATTIEPPAKLTKEPTVEDDAIESVTHEPNVITSPLSNTPAPLFYLPGTHDRQGNTLLIFNARIAGTVIDQDLLKRLFSVILFLTDRACNSIETLQHGICFISNLEDTQDRSAIMDLHRVILDWLQNCLPVKLSVVLCCNAPWWAQMFPFSIKPAVSGDGVMIDEIRMCSNLTAYIDYEQLPKQLGGGLQYKQKEWIADQWRVEHCKEWNSLLETDMEMFNVRDVSKFLNNNAVNSNSI